MLLDDRTVGKNFKIAFITDWHRGNRASSKDAIMETVEMIGVNNWYWWHLGDGIEATHLYNKYFDPLTQHGRNNEIKFQCQDFASIVRPIKSRCLALNEGNHERRKAIKSVLDATVEIRSLLGIDVPVAFTIKRKVADNCMIYGVHSNIYTNSQAKQSQKQRYDNECNSIKNRLVKLPGISDADAVLCGHGHKLRTIPPVMNTDIYGIDTLKMEQNRDFRAGHSIHADSKWYGMCGGALRTVIAKKYDPEADKVISDATGEVLSKGTVDITTYSEAGGYGYTDMGFSLATIDGGRLQNIEEIRV